ncbi:MAG TPA: hypothetical protein VH595_00190 [Verrucomicrobiae bacterium]|nr:hypothetical protein [Verrucomicrobiae bacterium]
MPESDAKVTLFQWLSYELLVLFEAWGRLSIWSLIWAVIGAMISILGETFFGLKTEHDAHLMMIITSSTAAIVFLGQFLINLLATPVALQKKALMTGEQARADANELRNKMGQKPRLEMLYATSPATRNQEGAIQVVIRNTSESITVKNVEVTAKSVEPKNVISSLFPARLKVFSKDPLNRTFIVDSLHGGQTSNFWLAYTSHEGGMGFLIDSRSSLIYYMRETDKFPNSQCVFELVATAEHTPAETMRLKLFWDGHEIKAELINSL